MVSPTISRSSGILTDSFEKLAIISQESFYNYGDKQIIADDPYTKVRYHHK